MVSRVVTCVTATNHQGREHMKSSSYSSRPFLAALLLAAVAPARHAAGQSVRIGSTELTLGMPALEATSALSLQFKLSPQPGTPQVWIIVDSLGPSEFRARGEIAAVNGKLVSISKELTPDYPTPPSVGEAVFTLLDRLASDGSNCTVRTSRRGVESGPGAGGTFVTATISCTHYTGTVSICQGSDLSMSHDPTISFELRSARSGK